MPKAIDRQYTGCSELYHALPLLFIMPLGKVLNLVQYQLWLVHYARYCT